MAFNLLEDETILLRVRPHPLAMYQVYLLWLYLAGLGLLFIMKGDQIVSIGGKLEFLGSYKEHLGVGLWAFVLFISAVVIAIFRVKLRWVLGLGLVIALGIFAHYKVFPGVKWVECWLLIACAVLGFLGTEVRRRSLVYVLTSFRIVVESGYLGSRNRTMLYDKINDVVVVKPMLGTVFRFGTVIPMTASGLGTGADAASGGIALGGSVVRGVGGGLFAGGTKSVTVPREIAEYSLFNIGRPERAYDLIVEGMHRAGRS